MKSETCELANQPSKGFYQAPPTEDTELANKIYKSHDIHRVHRPTRYSFEKLERIISRVSLTKEPVYSESNINP